MNGCCAFRLRTNRMSGQQRQLLQSIYRHTIGYYGHVV